MEKEFVPYNQAFRLKALGFDKPCMGVYYGDEDDMQFVLDVRETQYYAQKGYKDGILAPTFSQVFRWLRDKYMVHSSPKRYDETKWWVEYGTWTSRVFETFEEAELSWLNKLLEILESN